MRTDKPEAELYLYDGSTQLEAIKWQAHKELSVTLHHKIDELFNRADVVMENLDGIVLYKGPGSFTGLRIGFAVGNALASANHKPIIAEGGDDWIQHGIQSLLEGKNEIPALPEYGAAAGITLPKK